MELRIIQLFLLVLASLLISCTEGKNSTSTQKETSLSDELKEETGQYSFQVRPERNYGSRSSSKSSSSSKSHGSGRGKGVGYGSNGPQSKDPSHNNYGDEDHSTHYGSDYEDRHVPHEEYRGELGQGYKVNVENGRYATHNDKESTLYSGEYEGRSDDRRDSNPARGSNGKTHISSTHVTDGHSGSDTGPAGKVTSGISGSGGTYYSGLNNQQAGVGGPPYGDSRRGLIEHKHQSNGISYQEPAHQGSAGGHSYDESDDRVLSNQYGRSRNRAYNPVSPLNHKNAEALSFHSEGKENPGGIINNEKLAVFIRQLGNLPLGNHARGEKSHFHGNGDKYGSSTTGREKEQQGYILFPLIKNQDEVANKGHRENLGGNEGHDGEVNTRYEGKSDGKSGYGRDQNIGYAFNGYSPRPVDHKYESKQNIHGQSSGGSNFNAVGNLDYNGEKNQGYTGPIGSKESSYGSSYGRRAVAYEGKYPVDIGYSSGGQSKVFGIGGVHPSSKGYTQGSGYGAVDSYEKSPNYGPSEGLGQFKTINKLASPGSSETHDSNNQGDGYNQDIINMRNNGKTGAGGGYAVSSRSMLKNSGMGQTDYSRAGSTTGGGYDHGKEAFGLGKEYEGVVDFASNGGSGYEDRQGFSKLPESGKERQRANFEHFGKLEDILNYKQLDSSFADLETNSKSFLGSYPSIGISGGGYEFGKYPSHGVEQNIRNSPSFQPIAPRPKSVKSLALVLRKQPIHLPHSNPVSPFGGDLNSQLKAPFNHYFDGGINSNLGGRHGHNEFELFNQAFSGKGYHGAGLTSNVNGYSGGLSPLNFPSNQGHLY